MLCSALGVEVARRGVQVYPGSGQFLDGDVLVICCQEDGVWRDGRFGGSVWVAPFEGACLVFSGGLAVYHAQRWNVLGHCGLVVVNV